MGGVWRTALVLALGLLSFQHVDAAKSKRPHVSLNTTTYQRQEQLVDRSVTVLEAVSLGLTVDFVRAWIKLTVASDPLVFGSTVAFQPKWLPKGQLDTDTRFPDLYAPYASRATTRDGKVDRAGKITLSDILYDYTKEEWYESPVESFRNARKSMTDGTMPRSSYWSPEPYFDDGGGNIWMITFARAFAVSAENRTVRGVTTVDIALEHVDKNLCALGQHECNGTAPRCNFVSGLGNVDYAYFCCMPGCLECRTTDTVPDNGAPFREDDFCREPDIANGYVLKDNHAVESNVTVPFEINYSMRIPMVIMSVICMVAMLGFAIYIFVKKDLRVIKSSSPPFLYIMILGAILSLLWGVLAYAEPTNKLCIAGNWTVNVGFVILYGGLFLKTWRIYAIFAMKGKRARKSSISDKRLMEYLLAMTAFFCFVLTLWTTMDGMGVVTVVRTSTQEVPNTDYIMTTNVTALQCKSSMWVWILLVLNLLMLCGGGYLSFAVRKTPSAFNESRYIAVAIYIAVAVTMIEQAVILTRKTHLTPDEEYLMETLRHMIATVCTIVIIMLPKVVIIAQGRGDDVSVRPHKEGVIHIADTDNVTGAEEVTEDERVGGPYKVQLESLQRKYDTLMALYEKEKDKLGSGMSLTSGLTPSFVPISPLSQKKI